MRIVQIRKEPGVRQAVAVVDYLSLLGFASAVHVVERHALRKGVIQAGSGGIVSIVSIGRPSARRQLYGIRPAAFPGIGTGSPGA